MRVLPCSIVLVLALAGASIAQNRGGPPKRFHEANEAAALELIPAVEMPPARPDVSIELVGKERRVRSNGMPAHKIGTYPARHNPNVPGEQDYNVTLNGKPVEAGHITTADRHGELGPPNMPFGFAVNGIFFEPGTAEFWHGSRELGWNYEALGGAVPLGIDANYGHPQPNGAYHYHGLPTGLLKELGVSKNAHSPLVGWAADGVPIYSQYGCEDLEDPKSEIIEFRSSYRLRKGKRPGGKEGPGGKYDGAFARDYEYVVGAGNLDECNGRYTVTPEFPEGIYAYFLTEDWPVIPRKFRGEPVNIKTDFGGGPGRGPGKGGKGPKGGRGPPR